VCRCHVTIANATHPALTPHLLRPTLCRFFYASSACIYPEYKQLDVKIEGGGLKEGDAWPAQVRAGGTCQRWVESAVQLWALPAMSGTW
jgi:hypothetical protein